MPGAADEAGPGGRAAGRCTAARNRGGAVLQWGLSGVWAEEATMQKTWIIAAALPPWGARMWPGAGRRRPIVQMPPRSVQPPTGVRHKALEGGTKEVAMGKLAARRPPTPTSRRSPTAW